jgi:sugar/nucleoside kinase (ribokinase family)
VLVLGDLMLDVVLAPARALEHATDVPGRVSLRQGGSAANTARWLALLGARTTLVTAIGRDASGRALVQRLRRHGVRLRVSRPGGARTGRVGVLVDPSGERSFVADRGAADLLSPDDLRAGWFRDLDGLHLPVYSLLGQPLGEAGRRAIELARAAGAVVSMDLASIGPLMAGGRRIAQAIVRDARPDLLFATAAEADALQGRARPLDAMLEFAPVAFVKRGAEGTIILADHDGDRLRFEVAARRIQAHDTTGAGDAFDAGVLVAWLSAPAGDRRRPALLRRAALAGHRAAARQIEGPRPELALG